jgi:hypothetical protein
MSLLARARSGTGYSSFSHAWVRSRPLDRTNAALLAVFALGSLSYLVAASLAAPLALHGGRFSPYNELADAFLHLRLWVAHLPAHPPSGEALDPRLRPAVFKRYYDFALVGRYVYLTWGPAPVLVVLVPLHLLGFEPSGSAILLPFAIAGFGFSLAALRVVIRQIGGVPLWMTVLAGLSLAYGSILLFLTQHPYVYFEAIAAADCFAMAGVWLAISAVAARRPSRSRLGLMSLCFGLATGSRPTLAVTVLILAAVYASLRSIPQRRGWVVALLLPIGICFVLLGGYDQARFGDPLQYGTQYQLNPLYYSGHWGSLTYMPVGLWSYLLTPPHPSVLIPFLSLGVPQASYPLSLPAHYMARSEETGGLLVIGPIVIFLAALPWLWRRRPVLLGPLTGLLLTTAGAGILCLLFMSYEFFGTTERYEGDYTPLLLVGALGAWLALASATSVRRRRLVAALGGVLATWGCLVSIAVAGNELREHPSILRKAVAAGAPLSTVIAMTVGHPMLAEVSTPNVLRGSPGVSDLEANVAWFWLTVHDRAEIVVVSPDDRMATLTGTMLRGAANSPGSRPQLRVAEPSGKIQLVPVPSAESEVRIPIDLSRGVNRLSLSPVTIRPSAVTLEAEPQSNAAVIFYGLHVASG